MLHFLGVALVVAIGGVIGSAAAAQPPGADSSPPWSGRLQIRDQLFVDATGRPLLPLCVHFGEAFSAWTRRPGEVDEQLRQIRAAGYDCIRFWDNLGEYSDAWRGKEISPFTWTNGDGVRVVATPGYYTKLEEFLSTVKRHGLAVHHSRGDLGRATPAVPLERVVEHSREVAKLYDRVGWEVLALYEANNEDFQNGNYEIRGLARIVEPLQARGALVASSCAGECSEKPSEVAAYSRGFSVRYYHGRREGSAFDRLLRKFATGYERPRGAPALAWEGEPIGPNQSSGLGVTINATADVEELGLLHAMTLVGGKSAATYMSQHGVFWGGPIHAQAGFSVTPRIRAAIHDFAPDVMRWTLYHGARKEAALRAPRGYFGDAGVGVGAARLDQAVSPDRRRVVAMIYGGRGPARFRNELPCALRVTVIAPLDNEELQTHTTDLAPGNEHEVEYRVGRLLLAECGAS